jgi:hypothetical protein
MNAFSLLVLWFAYPCLPANAAPGDRIDLAECARVVRCFGQAPETLEVRSISRGPEGWEAWRDEGGQYTIGLE